MDDQHGAADNSKIRHLEQTVVHARQDLARNEEAEPDAVADAAPVEQTVEGPQRKRQPLRLLQLQMRHVVDAIGQEREHDAGKDGGGGVRRQRPHQQRGAGTRHHEAREQDQIMDEQRRDADPMERCRQDARQQKRFRERERLALWIKGVGVEQTRRRPRQLMRHPGQRPGVQQRIAIVMHAVVEMQRLRIGHHGGQRRKDQQHRREELHDWKMSSSSVSADSSCCAA